MSGGRQQRVAIAYAMFDRAGRLRLPAGYTAALGMADRVLLELEEDHIQVWPDGRANAPEAGDEDGRGRATAPAHSSGRGQGAGAVSVPHAFVRDVL